MSTTTYSQTSIFTVAAGFRTIEAINKLHKDRYSNNPELFEVDDLGDPTTELIDPIEPYLSFEDNKVIVSVDSESDEGNWDLELYRSICETLNTIQVGLCVENWATFNSKSGEEGGSNFYDEEGDIVDIHSLYHSHQTLLATAEALYKDGPNTPWDSSTIESVAEMVKRALPGIENRWEV